MAITSTTLTLRERNKLVSERLASTLKAAKAKPRGKTFGMYLPPELADRMSTAEVLAARRGIPIQRGYWAAVARAAFELVCEELEGPQKSLAQPLDAARDPAFDNQHHGHPPEDPDDIA